jgi:hypothetical protein
MKRLALAFVLLATPVMAQPAPKAPDSMAVHTATLDRVLAFFQADGGSVANDLLSKILTDTNPQVAAFQKAEADKKAAEAKTAPSAAADPAPAASSAAPAVPATVPMPTK